MIMSRSVDGHHGTQANRPPSPEKEKTMTTNNAPARKVRVTAQSVAFLALTEGTDAVAALHAKPGCEIAPATFDAAVDLLASQPETAAALSAMRSDLFGDDAPGERGRPAAKLGDSRAYKVQQVGDGDPFIRLPVSLLGAVKGGSVTVTFGRDGITVRG
jgi:hypothetical protein